MRLACLLVLVAGLVSAFGCQSGDKKSPPAAVTMEQATYEAEIAALKEQVQRQEARKSPHAIINCHEHLMNERHFPRYLAAARKLGIQRTVVVTSPEFTLFGKGDKTYASMAKNWADVSEAAKKYPGELIPFATVDPQDPDKLAHLQQMVAEGALGVKLYSGHSNLRDLPLDDASMMPIYAYIEEQKLPLNWHINLTKFSGEFERVMDAHPKLNVMIPHYGVGFWGPHKGMPALRQLMVKYPSMYVDTSLGTRDILVDGMYVMADFAKLFTEFFTEFSDRILYGSDAVITGNPEKTTNWFYLVIAGTLDQLEQETFVFPLAEGYSRYFKKQKRGHNPEGRVRGLSLPPEILKKVYEDNPKAWLEKHKPLPAVTR